MASYGRGVLHIDEKGIFLDSGLSPQEFARARMGQYISDEGYLLVPQPETQDYKISNFRFSGTQTNDQVDTKAKLSETETLLIEGESFAGKPLLAFLEDSANRENAINAVNTVCAAVEWNLRQLNAVRGKKNATDETESVIELLNCGPLGILVGDDGSILFLPFALFERSMLSREDEITSELYGCWTNTSLKKEDGWRFTLSCCAYTAFTGKKPFPELHIEKRTEDYFDNNFIPLDYCLFLNAEDEKSAELVHIINYNLELTGSAYLSIAPPKKKSRASSLASRALSSRSSTSGQKSQSIPLPLPMEMLSHKVVTSDFIGEQNKFVEKKAKELKRARFLRKQGTKINIGAIVLLVVGIVAGSIIKSNLEKPTTENMNPYEVVQTFYTALNELDSIRLDSCGDKKAIKGYSNMVSSLFVTGKMREAYEQAIPFLTPGQWVSTYNPLEFWVFGVTKLDITGKTTWNDIPQKGDSVNITALFNTVATNGYQNYEVTEYTDTLTLTFGKKYWQITDLSSETKNIAVDNEAFSKDITATLESIKADTSIKPTQQGEELVKMLGETYLWLPTLEDVILGLENLSAYLLFPPVTTQ